MKLYQPINNSAGQVRSHCPMEDHVEYPMLEYVEKLGNRGKEAAVSFLSIGFTFLTP